MTASTTTSDIRTTSQPVNHSRKSCLNQLHISPSTPSLPARACPPRCRGTPRSADVDTRQRHGRRAARSGSARPHRRCGSRGWPPLPNRPAPPGPGRVATSTARSTRRTRAAPPSATEAVTRPAPRAAAGRAPGQDGRGCRRAGRDRPPTGVLPTAPAGPAATRALRASRGRPSPPTSQVGASRDRVRHHVGAAEARGCQATWGRLLRSCDLLALNPKDRRAARCYGRAL